MVIYSLRIAKELTEKGFRIIDTGLNVNDISKKVFIFEDTEELYQELYKSYGIKIKR